MAKNSDEMNEGSPVIASPSRNSDKNPRRANGGENPEFQRGIRFFPYDDELIIYYLNKKIKNEKLPHDKIKDVNVYKCHPAELVAENDPVGDQEWYFFTSRDRKYPNGTQLERAVKGRGFWKRSRPEKKVFHDGKHVGSRKGLVFYEGKHKKAIKTNWIMHEYTSEDVPPKKRKHGEDMKLDDWVLCKIYDKEERKGFRGMQSLHLDQEFESEFESESEPEPEPLGNAAPLNLNDKDGELCREIIAARKDMQDQGPDQESEPVSNPSPSPSLSQ